MLDHQTPEADAELPCPGCGGLFAPALPVTHPYLESSPGCWAAFGEVLAREYSDRSLLDVHRLTVDAYAVQHPGTRRSRQAIQSVGLHLCRLLLVLEHGLPPELANDAMLTLGRHKATFEWLEPPAEPVPLTVANVLPLVEPSQHRAAVQAWSRAVLDAWLVHRATLERWLDLAAVARG
jgi:hypothetical protein